MLKYLILLSSVFGTNFVISDLIDTDSEHVKIDTNGPVYTVKLIN